MLKSVHDSELKKGLVYIYMYTLNNILHLNKIKHLCISQCHLMPGIVVLTRAS